MLLLFIIMSNNELNMEQMSITAVKSCQLNVQKSFEDQMVKCWRQRQEQQLLIESEYKKLRLESQAKARQYLKMSQRDLLLKILTPTWTQPEEDTIAKFANNLQKIIERLAAEDKAKRNKSGLQVLTYYPGTDKYKRDHTFTIQDLRNPNYSFIFSGLYFDLYMRTKENPLLIDYVSLCESKVLSNVKQDKSSQSQRDFIKKGNCVKLYLKLLIKDDKLLTNLCDLLRHPQFPKDLYNKTQIEYLVSIIPAQKKKRNKRKSKKESHLRESQESGEQDAQLPLPVAIDAQYNQIIDQLNTLNIAACRIECQFPAEFLQEIKHRLKYDCQ